MKSTWKKMNDNEQFILFIADLGGEGFQKKGAAVTPIPGGVKTLIPTFDTLRNSLVNSPRVEIDADESCWRAA